MMSESDVQARVRLLASQQGWRLWRNNVGAGKLENGSFLRWGLANDTPSMNREIKSGDLIGIRPVLILPEHVGTTIGQFASLEVKHEGWSHRPGNDREVAQKRWASLVNGLGGYAIISTGKL